MTWDELVNTTAEIAEGSSRAIAHDTRLIADLGLDSLAVTELVVVLIDEYGIETLSRDLDAIEWETLTVGALFETYVSRPGSPRPTPREVPRRSS